MGLFSTPGKKELKRARREAATNPTPLAYANLAEKYLVTGDPKAALKTVLEGLGRFPNSDMLERVHASVKRSHLEEDFGKLHEQLAQEANPTTMVRLARLYLETAEEGKALAMCARAIESFPDHDDAYAVVADTRLHRFYKDHTVKDALIAVANLERVIALNETNYHAYQSLAAFYLTVGMVSKALECLKTMLVFSPDDEWTHEKMDEAIALPRPDDENLESRLLEYAEQRSLAAQADQLAEQAAHDEASGSHAPCQLSEEIIAKIEEMAAQPGFHSGLLVDRNGNHLYSATHPETEPLELAEICTSVVEHAKRHSLRMNFGDFKKGVINAPFGHVILQTSGDVVFGVVLDPTARPEQYENEIESIAESARTVCEAVREESASSGEPEEESENA